MAARSQSSRVLEKREENRSSVTALLGIDAILFDAYGTLFDVQGVSAACAEVVPRPDVFVAEWRRRQLEYSWLRTLMARYADFEQVSADALDATASAHRATLTTSQRDALLAAWLRPAPYADVPDALAALADWHLGILSNGSPSMLRTVLDDTKLASCFTWILSVDQVRSFKPAPAAYELGVQATGLPRERIVFVSSNSWDVAGAASFGFVTCWLNRSNASEERLGQQARIVIQSLEELKNKLET